MEKLNHIPNDVSHVHLVAVCGTGMGALACMLKSIGLTVTGSDQNVYPPMSTFLADRGIQVSQGFSADHLKSRPDLVVVGNAVSKDNPEVLQVHALGLPYCSMPQAVNHFIAAGKKILVVTGTHGKTTTAALIAWLLYRAGLDPGYLIGGILKNFNSNFRLGGGEYVVLEGDEYDTAYFDKGPKFLHYRPHLAVMTSVEFDHADIFRDLPHVRHTFGRFIAAVPPESLLLVHDEIEQGKQLTEKALCRLETYGEAPASNWRVERIGVSPPLTRFGIYHNGSLLSRFESPLMGRHNLHNTLSAMAVAKHLSIGDQTLQTGLREFEGIKRRQEIRGVSKGVTVIDDFAHHPTAVRETLKAVRPHFTDGRIIAVFEPRSNSSRRNVFQEKYVQAFEAADLICIRRPPMLEKIPEAERFSSEKLVADLNAAGKSAHYFEDTNAILDFLLAHVRPQDLVLIMSNGGFDNIHERLLKRLE